MRAPINLIGGGFNHSVSSSGFDPIYMKWVKDNTSSISIYVDHSIKIKPNPNTKNYGWLSESKTIMPDVYKWCLDNIKILEENFISVFTHDINMLQFSNIFKLYNSGKSFIDESNGYVYTKSKLVSMIASNKKMCYGHIYRHQIISKFSNHCDHFGRGYNEIENKIDALKDYCFSITMENGTYSNMISEKITDCFMTGTIPIFYGIDNIGDFFNTEGIITLNDDFKIEDLSFDLYNSKIKAVSENLKISMDMLVSEDYIYLNYIKNNI